MMIPILDHFAPLAGHYDVLFCDVWGVVHNGVAANPSACDALQRYRAGGGRVVLLTNAPRPAEAVAAQLARLGVPADAYDAIVTSGGVARTLVARRPGVPLLHVGPERDLGLFAGLDAPRVGADEARYIVCTGLDDDETETPDDYRARFAPLLARGLALICANPDRIVERGSNIVWCAGALSDLYAELGGRTVDCGKPHAAIYDVARETAAAILGRPAEPARILAIGDALRTDLEGAAREGIDALFVVAGIHAGDAAPDGAIDPARLAALLGGLARPPVAAIATLSW